MRIRAIKIILAFLALALLSALPAQAQEQRQFYLQKRVQTNIQEAPKLSPLEQTLVPKTQTDPTVLLQGDDTTPAQTSFAERYYDNCLKAEHTNFTPQGQEALCACTAAQIQEVMTEEEINVMGQNTNAGQAVRDKVLIQVYGPCIRYPTHDLIFNRCMRDTELGRQLKKHTAVCTCLADKMADFVDQNAPDVLTTTMYSNPGITDPLYHMVESSFFNKKAQSFVQYCVQRDELGIKMD